MKSRQNQPVISRESGIQPAGRSSKFQKIASKNLLIRDKVIHPDTFFDEDIAYDALDDVNAVGNGINGDDGQIRHLDEKQRQRNGKHPDIDTVI